MTLDDLIVTGLLAVPVMLLFVVLAPPLQFLARATTAWASDVVADYHFAWMFRSAEVEHQKKCRRTDEEFAAWLSSHLGGPEGDAVDEELAKAQKLMSAIRLLLEDEIPGAVRRCNGIHRKMALLSGVIHMQEIALEPECLASRRWVAVLLTNTQRMLQEYPLRLRLEADELIHASIVLRKSLIPICTRCPYIQRTLATAGDRCPASELIQIDREPNHA